MKMSRLFVVAWIVSCVSLVIYTGKMNDDFVVPPAGDIMDIDYHLDRASKKITDLRNYIKKQRNFRDAAKFSSMEQSNDFRNKTKSYIKEELEAIKRELGE